jgi:uncharacterized protein YaiI (UPF0178 family)
MLTIYVDADACPVKDEILKVAERHGLETYLVSDGGIRPRPSPRVHLVVVAPGMDAADDWIAEHVETGDIVITADTPLAARVLEKGARALKPNGEPFTEQSIGMALATRDLMAGLRDAGMLTGGPPPFSGKERSKFLDTLETTIQAIQRQPP